LHKKENKMTKSKNNNLLLLIVFSLFTSLKSFSSDLEVEAKCPQIIRHSITGAGEFANLLEGYIEVFQGVLHLLSDVDGVTTDLSSPDRDRKLSHHSTTGADSDVASSNDLLPWRKLGLRQEPRSRGDMVPYLKSLTARLKSLTAPDFLLTFSSAWSLPTETFARLTYLGLLNAQEETQKETFTFERVEKLPPVTAEELKDAEDDEDWLEVLKNRPSEETVPYSLPFIQKGHCISIDSGDKYYRYKAFAPDVLFRKNLTAPQIDTLVFMEDSDYNIDLFLDHLPLTKYYPTLKTVIIFKFPEISGEIREEDKVDPKYLMEPSETTKQN
jgi:hypothetical protein